jgi:hypothetical protein
MGAVCMLCGDVALGDQEMGEVFRFQQGHQYMQYNDAA